MDQIRIGFGMCGSFCTFRKALEQMKELLRSGYTVQPIMSETAYRVDTRFGKAKDWIETVETLCRLPVIHSVADAEPLGPKKLVDVMAVCPCTGNTMAKLAHGVTDTPVTMAVKSCLRNQIPVVLTMATNDGLAASAQNIGALLNRKHLYFTPFGQDDYQKKPTSLVADFSALEPTILAALQGKQIQPILL